MSHHFSREVDRGCSVTLNLGHCHNCKRPWIIVTKLYQLKDCFGFKFEIGISKSFVVAQSFKFQI